MNKGLFEVDAELRRELDRRYEGYECEEYASGFLMENQNRIREILYDVFLKDGSRFVAVGRYNMNTGQISVVEKEYIKY